MSIAILQQRIRSCKTPVALGLSPSGEHLPKGLSCTETVEAMLQQGRTALDAAVGKLCAVYLRMESYISCGAAGFTVLCQLAQEAKEQGFYVILDCRACDSTAWLAAVPHADAITVMPYVGGDCCTVGEDKAAFALLRTANTSAGEVQNLMAGDRRLYQAAGEQMARRGAGAVVETGYSLDIRELRRRMEKTFLILTNCDGEAASCAFDEYGHGALVVDETIQYASDPATAVMSAVKAMKQWVMVL